MHACRRNGREALNCHNRTENGCRRMAAALIFGNEGDMDIDEIAAQPAFASPPEGDWTKILARYREPDLLRSLFEIVITAAPFVTLWLVMWVALDHGYWPALLLAVPAAGFLVRLFMIQHDCGHNALFRRRAVNDWVGRIIGVLTLTPYDLWRQSHATHHATTGNLDRRGIGDI